MRVKHWRGPRFTVQDVLAYVSVLLLVGCILKLLPAAAMTGLVWAILWRTLAVVVIIIVPLFAIIVVVRKYLQLVKKASG
jgi:heme/copper-type cytochrome/quinol oxidase subunit 2